MTQVIWIDSRMRSSGTDSDFEVSLRDSVHLSDARVRVDRITFVDSILTTDAGRHLFFQAMEGGSSTMSIPEGAYTGASLASAIQAATGRTTTYDPLTNSITHQLESPSQRWLSDAELAAERSFPPGATRGDPRSLSTSFWEMARTAAQPLYGLLSEWLRGPAIIFGALACDAKILMDLEVVTISS